MDAIHGIDHRTVFPEIVQDFRDYPDAELRKAAALIQVCNAKGIAQVDVVAHSEGAMYVAIAATLRPERFRNLVFIAPAGMLRFGGDGTHRLHAVIKFARHYLAHRFRGRSIIHMPDVPARMDREPARSRHKAGRVGLARLVRTLAHPSRLIAEAFAQADYSIDTLMEQLSEYGTAIVVVLSVGDTLYTCDRLAGDGGTIGRGSTINRDMVKGVLTIRNWLPGLTCTDARILA